MRILFTDTFKKKFRKLPLKIQAAFGARVGFFIKDPFHPLLKNHPLKGNFIGLRAFSVTGDYRVIFRFLDKENARFVDIGTHSQVYK